jgi:excisionase family DNA binding protein
MQITHDVLTLDEVADYLRLPIETVERQANRGQLPARRIEDTWRFLKSAVDDWLRSQDNRVILLQLADDESLSALRAGIYEQRGRLEIETTG